MNPRIADRVLRWLLALGVLVLAGAAVVRVTRPLQQPQAPDPVVSFEPGWQQLLRSGYPEPFDDSATVVLVEFFDLQCPACRTYHGFLRRAKEEFGPDLAVRYVHFPLSTHLHAPAAARAAECARKQGAFDRFIDVVYASQDEIGSRSWLSFGSAAGVKDSSAFSICVTTKDTVPVIAAGRRLGGLLNVSATPTILLNGWRFKYPPSEELLFDTIKRLIDGKRPRGANTQILGRGQLTPSRTVRSGIPLISYSSGARAALPHLGLAAQAGVTFGLQESPPIDMQGVRAVQPLSRGRIAAIDRYLPVIYVFDAEGQLLSSLGRRGDGPGEFRTVHDLAVLPNDSLAVLDQNSWRLTVFALDSGVRTAQMPANVPTRFARLVGRLSTGELVLTSVPSIRAPDGQDRARLPLQVAIVDSSQNFREILQVPDFEVALQPTRFGGRSSMTPTFVRLAPRADVRVMDSLIAVTTGDEFAVRFYDRSGRPVSEVRVDLPRRRVTEAMRAAQVARDLDILHNVMREPPAYMEESERVLKEAPYSEWLPAIDELVDSNDGLLWVLEGSAPTDSMWSALAFEPSGALVRRVQGPSNVHPVLFRVGNVVVRTTDSDGLVGFESRAFRRLD